MRFPTKHEARIYTDKSGNIEKIKAIMTEIDQYEAEYCPNDLIAVFEGKIDYVYTGKFDDLEMDELMKRCWEAGIHAFYVIKDRRYTFD